jgi:FkbM family methyltransferase
MSFERRIVSRMKRLMPQPVWHGLRHRFQTRKRIRVGGVEVIVRDGTWDTTVAHANLGEEFDILHAAELPPPRHGFIVDAGGYIGTAAIALSRLYPEATVVTLEPSRANFDMLRRNVRPFPNIVPLNLALTAGGGAVVLGDPDLGDWAFRVVEPDRSARAFQRVDSTTVPALLERFGRTGIDLLKLDIEGSERELLDGSAGWIGKVSVLLAELHERYVPGCEAAWERATAAMEQMPRAGEKVIAVSRG